MEQINVIGYARKSPDDKEDTKTSIISQNKLFVYTCKEKLWTLVKVFEDANVSGSKRKRKGFDETISFLKLNPHIKIVLVKDSSRFTRDSSFFKDTLIDLYANYGIKFYSCMKGDFLDPHSLVDKILSNVDEEAIVKGRKNADITFSQKKDEGLPPIKAPFGYNNDKKTKSFKIVNKEAEIVLGVCQDSILGLDYSQIIKKYRINAPKYYRIIKNAKNGLYSGFIYYQKKIKDSKGDIIRLEEVKYKSDHPYIISEELFKKFN